MSIDRLLVGSRSVLAIRVTVRRLELEISSCHVLSDLHKISWPRHLHEFASDRVFELKSFPLQSDVDFMLLQVLARTRGQLGLTPPVVQGQQVKRTKLLAFDCLKTPMRRSFCFVHLFHYAPIFNIFVPDCYLRVKPNTGRLFPIST